MKRAIIVGLRGDDRKKVEYFLKNRGFLIMDRFPKVDLTENDLAIVFPGPAVPVIIDRSIEEIHRTVGNKLNIVFLGNLKEKMYLYNHPVIPPNLDALEEVLNELNL